MPARSNLTEKQQDAIIRWHKRDGLGYARIMHAFWCKFHKEVGKSTVRRLCYLADGRSSPFIRKAKPGLLARLFG